MGQLLTDQSYSEDSDPNNSILLEAACYYLLLFVSLSLSFSMGGVTLVSFSSMDNPDEKGVIGNHGNRKLSATLSHRHCDLCDFEMLM